MSALAGRAYAKMHGLGNEILVVDLRDAAGEAESAEIAALARSPGFGFDQLMAIHSARGPDAAAFVRIYNADGSKVGACGNGSRCVAWFLLRERAQDEISFETEGGLVVCRREGPWEFSADMGRPRFEWNEIPLRAPVADPRAAQIDLDPDDAPLGLPSVVSMGNPHAIFWVEDFEPFDLARLGPRLERHPDFPERANISLAKIVSRGRLMLRVWERGAGLTKACGTAACAAVVAAARLGRCERTARVSLPGGDLTIEWRDDGHVLMTGPCALERTGRLDSALLSVAEGVSVKGGASAHAGS